MRSWAEVPQVSAVYALFADGICIYVGSSFNLRARLINHKHLHLCGLLRWEACPPEQLEAMERRWFRELSPTLNQKRIRRPSYAFRPTKLDRFLYPHQRPYTIPEVTSGAVNFPLRKAS